MNSKKEMIKVKLKGVFLFKHNEDQPNMTSTP